MEDGITADVEYATVNARWDITDNLNFEAILSNWKQFARQVIDFDGTEFLVTTDDLSTDRENDTMEFHLSGTALNERINWLGGYYSLEERHQDSHRSVGHVRMGDPRLGPPPPTAFPLLRASTSRRPSTCVKPLRCSV